MVVCSAVSLTTRALESQQIISPLVYLGSPANSSTQYLADFKLKLVILRTTHKFIPDIHREQLIGLIEVHELEQRETELHIQRLVVVHHWSSDFTHPLVLLQQLLDQRPLIRLKFEVYKAEALLP